MQNMVAKSNSKPDIYNASPTTELNKGKIYIKRKEKRTENIDLPVGDEAPLQASPVKEGEEVLRDPHKVIVREMLRPTKKQLSQFSP